MDRRRGDARYRTLRAGELDPEGAALTDDACHADGSAHYFDEALGPGQAEAGALHASGLGPEPVEGREEPLHQSGRDARTRVGNVDAEAVRGRFLHLDGDRAAGPVELGGIGEEIQKHLLESLTVGQDVAASGLRGSHVD